MQNSRGENKKQDEKIGRAMVTLMWIWFTIKFIGITSLLALLVLWILRKPLWLSPIIAVGLYIVYRSIRMLFVMLLAMIGEDQRRDQNNRPGKQ